MISNKKLIFVVNQIRFFWTHRLPIAQKAIEEGMDVVLVAPDGEMRIEIENLGIRHIPLLMSRSGRNPLSEVDTIRQLVKIYQREKPDILHHVTIKPVLYGGIASKLLGINSVVSAISGLGYVFINKGKKADITRFLVLQIYRAALRQNKGIVIFQNENDQNILQKNKVIGPDRSVLIRGSGVDLKKFNYVAEKKGTKRVIFASRMLWDKGVGEFVEAARRIGKKRSDVVFTLVGDEDVGNPNSVTNLEIKQWETDGVVEWWRTRNDMPTVFADSHIVCLPTTYGEGVPKVLIEAAACGRPCITTDSPGCRDIVRNGLNGITIQNRNTTELETAIEDLLNNKKKREEMGKNGREIAEQNFSEISVISKTIEIYKQLISENK